MGEPQLVHYEPGQKYGDWFARPRLRPGDNGPERMYNRVATFFAVLEANCTGVETWFPEVRPFASQDRYEPSIRSGKGELWREYPEGGLAFRPIPGNALFWVNMSPEGGEDERVVHAGLPVESGTKTAMNI